MYSQDSEADHGISQNVYERNYFPGYSGYLVFTWLDVLFITMHGGSEVIEINGKRPGQIPTTVCTCGIPGARFSECE